MKKISDKNNSLTEHITYRIIDDTIHLFQNDAHVLKEEILLAMKKISLLIEDNDLAYINISASKIEDKKEEYQSLGFTLSYYDPKKLRTLYPNKKNKMDYKCYGIMTRSDFFNKLEDNDNMKTKVVISNKSSSNKGFVNSLLLLVFGILVLGFICIDGAVLLVK